MKALMGRAAVLVFTAALAFGSGVPAAGAREAVSVGTASAAVVPGPGWAEIFAPYIRARGNTMCLDVPAGSTQNYVALQLFHCHGSDSQGAVQRWQFVPEVTTSDGVTAYAIVNSGNNLCLSWVLAFRDIPSSIVQLPCPPGSGSASTLWVIKQSPGNPDDFELGLVFASNGNLSPAFNGCLAALNTSDVNGTLFGLHTCAAFDDATQIFNLG